MDPIQSFEQERSSRIEKQGENAQLKEISEKFTTESVKSGYSYNFSWMGRPIIQYPQDMIAMQEIIWQVKPDLIIETGIAHGGSLIYYASLLELIGKGEILGIDIDIREHNKIEIEAHSMSKRIAMIQGSSVDSEVLIKVKQFAKDKKNILVSLDSNHSHSHVLKEMNLYSAFVSQGSYLVVFDTVVEDLPIGTILDRPWDKGNNAKTAVHEFLRTDKTFEIDQRFNNKLLVSVAPDGYLKKIISK
jgi:cephalosporin hydroxylase